MIFLFLFGLVFGSFYTVVALRLPQGKSLIRPPSHCPRCRRRLSCIDLIPLFSYIVRRGRCRFCRLLISPIYPLTELTTAVLFLLAYLSFNTGPQFFFSLALISLLVVTSVSDVCYRLISDAVLLFFTAVLILLYIAFPPPSLLQPIIGAVVGWMLLFVPAIVAPGSIGGGDIKLFAVLGLVLGVHEICLTLFLASSMAMIYCICIFFRGTLRRKMEVPFAPFIAGGALLAHFFGDFLISFYLSTVWRSGLF